MKEETMSFSRSVEIVTKEQLKNDIFKFAIQSEEMAKVALPGQFLEIRVNDNIEPFLRRPISIHKIEQEESELEFIFQVRGKGTEILAQKQVGDKISVLGPLGKGSFQFENYKNIAIIGGGIGIFPLYELARQARENAKVTTYLGFRNKDFVVLENEFLQVSNKLVLTTDDGSYGQKGFAIDYLKEDCQKEKPDCIYACGPLPMLKVVRDFAIQNNIPAQVSLEERMGCGIGICLGCSVKDKNSDGYKHVCKDGPVFDIADVEF